MDVYRFVPFIGAKEKPPAENHFESLAIVCTPLSVDIVPSARYQVTLHVPRYALDAAQLFPAITLICDLRCVRVEPELGAAILSVAVRVSRLTTVVRVEIEAIRPTLRIVGIVVILCNGGL